MFRKAGEMIHWMHYLQRKFEGLSSNLQDLPKLGLVAQVFPVRETETGQALEACSQLDWRTQSKKGLCLQQGGRSKA